MKRYEKWISFISVDRHTLVRPKRLWSAQANWRTHVDGYAFTWEKPGPNARLPSWE
jgi:hypothetical protein